MQLFFFSRIDLTESLVVLPTAASYFYSSFYPPPVFIAILNTRLDTPLNRLGFMFFW